MHKSKIGNKNILLANKGKFVRVIILQPQFLFITPHYKHSLKYIFNKGNYIIGQVYCNW